MAGALFAAIARDIVNELPLQVKIAAVVLVAIVAAVITVKRNWAKVINSGVLDFLISGAIGAAIGSLSILFFSHDVTRIIGSVCSILLIILLIRYLYPDWQLIEWKKRVSKILLVLCFIICLLCFTHTHLLYYSINYLTTHIIGRPIYNVVRIHDRSILYSYQTSGYGTVIYTNGTTYNGELIDGIPNGYGVLSSITLGRVYEGEFIDGHFNGEGILTFDNGQIEEGTWVDGNRHGIIIVTSPDGEVIEVEYLDGEIVQYLDS